MRERTRVVFVAGSGRSGSTLLDNILGQIDGYFSVGELRYIWERGLVENRLCGCGRRFRECDVWHSVMDEAFGGIVGVDARAMIEQQHEHTRARHLPLVLARRKFSRLSEPCGDRYTDTTSRLYGAIRAVTGSQFIVDSSKLPTYGYVLERDPSIELYVVHLVRDPRATAYSWTRTKVQPDRGSVGYMQRQLPFKAAMLWGLWNRTAEAIWAASPERYLRLRYEQLVQDPQESVHQILSLLGDAGKQLPFVSERTVRLRPNHSVAGNPVRLKDGNVTLSADGEWVDHMPLRTRVLVTAATSPLLHRYGYSLWRPDEGYSASR